MMGYIKTINGFEIWQSDRHGKCVNGKKQSTSIQVRKPHGEGYMLVKQVSFPINDLVKKKITIARAELFITEIKITTDAK